MLSSIQIKKLKSLHQKKFRRQENRFLLEGHRLIEQALSANVEIEEIWMTKKSLESSNGKDIIKQIENSNISWSIAPNNIIKQISDSLNDQGIIALAPIPGWNLRPGEYGNSVTNSCLVWNKICISLY